MSRPPWMINGWTVHLHWAAVIGAGVPVKLVSPGSAEIEVPFSVLAEVVGVGLRDEHIERLGQLTGQQYLTMLAGHEPGGTAGAQ